MGKPGGETSVFAFKKCYILYILRTFRFSGYFNVCIILLVQNVAKITNPSALLSTTITYK